MKIPVFSLSSCLFVTQSFTCTFCSCLHPLWRISSELFAGFGVWIYSDVIVLSVFFQFVLFLFILKCSSGAVAFWPETNSCSRFLKTEQHGTFFPYTGGRSACGVQDCFGIVPVQVRGCDSPSPFCCRYPSSARRKRSLVIWQNTLFQWWERRGSSKWLVPIMQPSRKPRWRSGMSLIPSSVSICVELCFCPSQVFPAQPALEQWEVAWKST